MGWHLGDHHCAGRHEGDRSGNGDKTFHVAEIIEMVIHHAPGLEGLPPFEDPVRLRMKHLFHSGRNLEIPPAGRSGSRAVGTALTRCQCSMEAVSPLWHSSSALRSPHPRHASLTGLPIGAISKEVIRVLRRVGASALTLAQSAFFQAQRNKDLSAAEKDGQCIGGHGHLA